MKEHPIPQDITGYRFHIVGSMTLKQFGEVLIGVIISLVIYQTNLIAIIKWPLVILFTGAGLLSAFVPIEERPISHWLATFFGIIYKPTQFFWKRTQNIPEPFLFQGNKEDLVQVNEVDLTPARRQRIKEFLNSTKAITPDPDDFTAYEQQQLSLVMDLFQTGPQAAAIYNPTNIQKPELTVRVRTMRVTEEFQELPQEPDYQPFPVTVPTSAAEPPAVILPDPVVVRPEYSDKKDVYLETEQVAQNIQIPETAEISVTQSVVDTPPELSAIQNSQSNLGKQVFIADQQESLSTEQKPQAVQATFNSSLPFPDKPTEPNKLVGMILNDKNEILSNSIVEISTTDGHVARAVKTNALGQFTITTPLRSGKYVVNVQKEGYTFDPIQIDLTGSIVDPLEIRSTTN